MVESKAAVTIFHNPACSTSRKALDAIRASGRPANIVEYMKIGWRRDELERLFAQMGVTARQALRTRGTRAEALRLTAPDVTDETIIGAMVADPVLVERPIVVSEKGAALCRPVDRIAALL